MLYVFLLWCTVFQPKLDHKQIEIGILLCSLHITYDIFGHSHLYAGFLSLHNSIAGVKTDLYFVFFKDLLSSPEFPVLIQAYFNRKTSAWSWFFVKNFNLRIFRFRELLILVGKALSFWTIRLSFFVGLGPSVCFLKSFKRAVVVQQHFKTFGSNERNLLRVLYQAWIAIESLKKKPTKTLGKCLEYVYSWKRFRVLDTRLYVLELVYVLHHIQELIFKLYLC